MKKSFRKSHKKKIKKPFWKKELFWIIFLIIILLSLIFYLLIFSNIFQLKHIEVSGNEKIEKESIISFVENKARKKIISLESNSIFLFLIENVQEETIKAFPRIKEIKICLRLPQTIKVFVIERNSLGRWCNKHEECYLIDNEGVLFEKIETSSNKMILFRSKRKGQEGSKVLTKEELKIAMKIWEEIKNDFEILEFEFDSNTLTAETTKNGKLLFNLNNDIDSQLLKLKSVINEKLSKEKIDKIDYIDLRFGDRVYFKTKD